MILYKLGNCQFILLSLNTDWVSESTVFAIVSRKFRVCHAVFLTKYYDTASRTCI